MSRLTVQYKRERVSIMIVKMDQNTLPELFLFILQLSYLLYGVLKTSQHHSI